jgi:hypothetical protein
MASAIERDIGCHDRAQQPGHSHAQHREAVLAAARTSALAIPTSHHDR